MSHFQNCWSMQALKEMFVVVDVVGTDLLMELVRSAPPHLLSTRPGPGWMSRRQNGSLQFHQMPRRMTNQIATSCLVV